MKQKASVPGAGLEGEELHMGIPSWTIMMSQAQISGRVAAGEVAVKQQHKMMIMLMSVHMHYLAVVLAACCHVPLKDSSLKSVSHRQLCFHTVHDSAWG